MVALIVYQLTSTCVSIDREVTDVLWQTWWTCVQPLRPAFTREVTFLWFCVALVGITVRHDTAGVTSYVRCLGLRDRCYKSLLDMFHSRAIRLDKLTASWASIVLKTCAPYLCRFNGRYVCLGDGIKIAKEGKKMPAVKKLHQESQSNTKPTYIMGHSCQAIALLAGRFSYFFAIPLASRIHEGLIFPKTKKTTLLDKMAAMLAALNLSHPIYFVADAYYASGRLIKTLRAHDVQLITRARSNAVAYKLVKASTPSKRGRPQKYGAKVKLKHLFNSSTFAQADSPVYGEKGIPLLYSTRDLMWRPVGDVVRFVLVKHPKRGFIILMSTDRSLDAIDIIRLYGLRFKIEVSFKQAVHTLGTYSYHFWMKSMKAISRQQGNQSLQNKSDQYIKRVTNKMHAYHTHIQLGTIAQGLVVMLSIMANNNVWHSFGSWLRTIRKDVLPSEAVTAMALRNTLAEYLDVFGKRSILLKFLIARIDTKRAEGYRLVAA